MSIRQEILIGAGIAALSLTAAIAQEDEIQSEPLAPVEAAEEAPRGEPMAGSPFRPVPGDKAAMEKAREAADAPQTTRQGPPPEIMSASETPAAETVRSGEVEINPDEMADMLNKRQQIQQSYTFTRKINGEVVETDTRTVTFSRETPLRQSEAGVAPHEALRAAFDSELLTRTEAEEEAELDFDVADRDHDNMMTADEFAGLVDSWRLTERRNQAAVAGETARERQYRRFVESLDLDEPDAADSAADARARARFAYMAGAAGAVSRDEYIREYMLDFDSMDANGDALLKGDELIMFRAMNRGDEVSVSSTASQE